MKKILIVLALIASVQVANAQGGVAGAKKALDAALEASQNAKKATKVATWTKLAETYLDAYNAPSANVWVGASENELKLAMGNDKPSSTENVVLGGEQYVKQVFSNKNLYFNSKGQLEFVDVTKPVVENALGKALEAYKKAYEIDTKEPCSCRAFLRERLLSIRPEAQRSYRHQLPLQCRFHCFQRRKLRQGKGSLRAVP